jgi:hypothetical protein
MIRHFRTMSMKVGLELVDRRADVLAVLFSPALGEVLPRGLRSFSLGVLGRSDLGLNILERPPHNRSAKSFHGRVDHGGALLICVGQQCRVADRQRLRDVAQRRLGAVAS